MKKAFIIALSVLMMTLLLAGCGKKETATSDSATPDSSVSSKITETTKVIETTTEGGTVEQDKEGNVIEKDKSGEIVSVKDEDGKIIEITEYITAHTYVVEGSGDDDSSDSDSSDSSSSSRSSDSGSQSSSKTEEGSKEDAPKPTIAEEDMDEYELPIL